MQETPQEYTARILGYQRGKKPLAILASTPRKINRLIKSVPRTKLMTRPEPKKWSIAEILAHLADTELVGGFRMRLTIGMNGTPIQGFDQDVWAEKFNYGKRDPQKSFAVFQVLREHNLALLKSIPGPLWDNYGVHSERGKETVTRITEMMAGHDLNHMAQIEKIVNQESRRSKK
ncbi:MAG TPA: DinB family protein [Bacteroidota bacterium]|nr:DinB family protein [Bacteroidota bacterium]